MVLGQINHIEVVFVGWRLNCENTKVEGFSILNLESTIKVGIEHAEAPVKTEGSHQSLLYLVSGPLVDDSWDMGHANR